MQPPDDYRADDQFSGSRAAHPVIQPVSARLLEQQRVSPTTSPAPSATAAAEAPGTLPATAVQSTGYPAFHPNPAVRDEALFMTSPEQFAQAAALAQYQQSIASGFIRPSSDDLMRYSSPPQAQPGVADMAAAQQFWQQQRSGLTPNANAAFQRFDATTAMLQHQQAQYAQATAQAAQSAMLQQAAFRAYDGTRMQFQNAPPRPPPSQSEHIVHTPAEIDGVYDQNWTAVQEAEFSPVQFPAVQQVPGAVPVADAAPDVRMTPPADRLAASVRKYLRDSPVTSTWEARMMDAETGDMFRKVLSAPAFSHVLGHISGMVEENVPDAMVRGLLRGIAHSQRFALATLVEVPMFTETLKFTVSCYIVELFKTDGFPTLVTARAQELNLKDFPEAPADASLYQVALSPEIPCIRDVVIGMIAGNLLVRDTANLSALIPEMFLVWRRLVYPFQESASISRDAQSSKVSPVPFSGLSPAPVFGVPHDQQYRHPMPAAPTALSTGQQIQQQAVIQRADPSTGSQYSFAQPPPYVTTQYIAEQLARSTPSPDQQAPHAAAVGGSPSRQLTQIPPLNAQQGDQFLDYLVGAGSTHVQVADNSVFQVGQDVLFNPGGQTEEVRTVIGLGSIILDRPLNYTHMPGEIMRVVHPPAAPSPGDAAAPDPVATRAGPPPRPPQEGSLAIGAALAPMSMFQHLPGQVPGQMPGQPSGELARPVQAQPPVQPVQPPAGNLFANTGVDPSRAPIPGPGMLTIEQVAYLFQVFGGTMASGGWSGQQALPGPGTFGNNVSPGTATGPLGGGGPPTFANSGSNAPSASMVSGLIQMPKDMPKMSSVPAFPRPMLPKGLTGSLWEYWYLWDEWVAVIRQLLWRWWGQLIVVRRWDEICNLARTAHDEYAWAVAQPIEVMKRPVGLEALPANMWNKWARREALTMENNVNPLDHLPRPDMQAEARKPELTRVVEAALDETISDRLEKIFDPETLDHCRSMLSLHKHLKVPPQVSLFGHAIKVYNGSNNHLEGWRSQIVNIALYPGETLFRLTKRWDYGKHMFEHWAKDGKIHFNEARNHFKRNIHPVLASRLDGRRREEYLDWYKLEDFDRTFGEEWDRWPGWMQKVSDLIPHLKPAKAKAAGLLGESTEVTSEVEASVEPDGEAFLATDLANGEENDEIEPELVDDPEANLAKTPKAKAKPKPRLPEKPRVPAEPPRGQPPGQPTGVADDSEKPWKCGTRLIDLDPNSDLCNRQKSEYGCSYGPACRFRHLSATALKECLVAGEGRGAPPDGKWDICPACNGPHPIKECTVHRKRPGGAAPNGRNPGAGRGRGATPQRPAANEGEVEPEENHTDEPPGGSHDSPEPEANNAVPDTAEQSGLDRVRDAARAAQVNSESYLNEIAHHSDEEEERAEPTGNMVEVEQQPQTPSTADSHGPSPVSIRPGRCSECGYIAEESGTVCPRCRSECGSEAPICDLAVDALDLSSQLDDSSYVTAASESPSALTDSIILQKIRSSAVLTPNESRRYEQILLIWKRDEVSTEVPALPTDPDADEWTNRERVLRIARREERAASSLCPNHANVGREGHYSFTSESGCECCAMTCNLCIQEISAVYALDRPETPTMLGDSQVLELHDRNANVEPQALMAEAEEETPVDETPNPGDEESSDDTTESSDYGFDPWSTTTYKPHGPENRGWEQRYDRVQRRRARRAEKARTGGTTDFITRNESYVLARVPDRSNRTTPATPLLDRVREAAREPSRTPNVPHKFPEPEANMMSAIISLLMPEVDTEDEPVQTHARPDQAAPPRQENMTAPDAVVETRETSVDQANSFIQRKDGTTLQTILQEWRYQATWSKIVNDRDPQDGNPRNNPEVGTVVSNRSPAAVCLRCAKGMPCVTDTWVCFDCMHDVYGPYDLDQRPTELPPPEWSPSGGLLSPAMTVREADNGPIYDAPEVYVDDIVTTGWTQDRILLNERLCHLRIRALDEQVEKLEAAKLRQEEEYQRQFEWLRESARTVDYHLSILGEARRIVDEINESPPDMPPSPPGDLEEESHTDFQRRMTATMSDEAPTIFENLVPDIAYKSSPDGAGDEVPFQPSSSMRRQLARMFVRHLTVSTVAKISSPAVPFVMMSEREPPWFPYVVPSERGNSATLEVHRSHHELAMYDPPEEQSVVEESNTLLGLRRLLGYPLTSLMQDYTAHRYPDLHQRPAGVPPASLFLRTRGTYGDESPRPEVTCALSPVERVPRRGQILNPVTDSTGRLAPIPLPDRDWYPQTEEEFRLESELENEALEEERRKQRQGEATELTSDDGELPPPAADTVSWRVYHETNPTWPSPPRLDPLSHSQNEHEEDYADPHGWFTAHTHGSEEAAQRYRDLGLEERSDGTFRIPARTAPTTSTTYVSAFAAPLFTPAVTTDVVAYATEVHRRSARAITVRQDYFQWTDARDIDDLQVPTEVDDALSQMEFRTELYQTLLHDEQFYNADDDCGWILNAAYRRRGGIQYAVEMMGDEARIAFVTVLSKVAMEFQLRVPTPPFTLDSGASHEAIGRDANPNPSVLFPLPRIPYGTGRRPGQDVEDVDAATRETARVAGEGIFGEPIPRSTVDTLNAWHPFPLYYGGVSSRRDENASAGPVLPAQPNVPDVEMAYLDVPDEDDDEDEWEPHNLLGAAESEPSTAGYEPEPAHELPSRQPSSLRPPWDNVDFDSMNFAAGFHKGMEHAIEVMEERARVCVKVTGSRRTFRAVGGICHSVREIREERKLSNAINTLVRRWRKRSRKPSMNSEDRDQPLDEDDLPEPENGHYVEAVHIPEEVRMYQDGFSLSPHIRPNRAHHGHTSARYLEAYLTPLRLCDRILQDGWKKYQVPGDPTKHDHRPVYALDLCDRTGTLKEGINGAFDAYVMKFGLKPLLPDEEAIITKEIAEYTYDQIAKDRLVALKPPNWTAQYQEVINKYRGKWMFHPGYFRSMTYATVKFGNTGSTWCSLLAINKFRMELDVPSNDPEALVNEAEYFGLLGEPMPIESRNRGIVPKGAFALDSGASDVFAVIGKKDLPSDLKSVTVTKVGKTRDSYSRNLMGEILLPIGSTPLLPLVPMMTLSLYSTFFIQGMDGPICGNVPPEKLQVIYNVLKEYAVFPIRNNIPYVPAEFAEDVRAHLGNVSLKFQNKPTVDLPPAIPPPLRAQAVGFQ